METRTALITGITGQDGSLLAKYLLTQNYKIIAPTRCSPDKSNLITLKLDNHVNIKYITYSTWSDFDEIIKKHQPHEIYHLAAMSHVGQSHKNPEKVFDVNTTWSVNLLNAILKYSPTSKFFFASSCEIFRNDIDKAVTETDYKQPTNPYGISKLATHLMVEYQRKVNNLFACNGILFNHESVLRSKDFVSKKIAREVARIVKHGCKSKPLLLGNIDAKKDWGYAPDYVKFFHSMLQCEKAEDFIIATGVLHSVKDMVDCAFNALDCGISWQGEGLNTKAYDSNGQIVVTIDEKYFRPLDNRFLCGNYQKAKEQLNFNNLTPFDTWVKTMTIAEYQQA